MGLENIIGKWPGDETDEEITKAIKDMNACRECEKLRKQLAKAKELFVDYCDADPSFRMGRKYAEDWFDAEMEATKKD